MTFQFDQYPTFQFSDIPPFEYPIFRLLKSNLINIQSHFNLKKSKQSDYRRKNIYFMTCFSCDNQILQFFNERLRQQYILTLKGSASQKIRPLPSPENPRSAPIYMNIEYMNNLVDKKDKNIKISYYQILKDFENCLQKSSPEYYIKVPCKLSHSIFSSVLK